MAKHTKTTRLTAAEFRAKRNRIRLMNVLLIILLLVAMFCVGFMIRGNADLMDKLGIYDYNDSEEKANSTQIGSNTYESISARIAEVENLINKESFDTYDLDSTTQSMLDAFISSTQDQHSRYYTPARYSAYLQENKSTKTNYGVGVLLGEYEGHAYVVDVFEDSPASKAGVLVGDFVEAINGDRSDLWSATEASNALSDENHETVFVTWRRPTSLSISGGTEFTTELRCQENNEVNVTANLDEKVGNIKIAQLTSNSGALVKEAVQNLEGQGAEGFVLDLRDCPGGYLTQAVEICSLFMKSGTVCQVLASGGTSSKSVTGNTVTEKPVVVLVNGNTAAAAEVIACGLQNSGIGQVVGTTTLGKGSVQTTTKLSFGGALRYTVAYYLTPNNHNIEGEGIAPNITVDNTNAKNGVDKQYVLAKQVANNM